MNCGKPQEKFVACSSLKNAKTSLQQTAMSQNNSEML